MCRPSSQQNKLNMATLDLSKAYRIINALPNPVANLAARELQETLAQICGQTFPIQAQREPGTPALVLDFKAGEGEGFAWQIDAEDVSLTGESPRGLLHAVYSFLEALGCCWFAPGKAGAYLPRGAQFNLPDREQSAPALSGRCLIIGHHAFMQDAAEWIIWAGRNRLNTLFFHTTEGSLALGAVHESQYQALKPVFLPLLQERGMVLEHGGHGLAGLLPRALFNEMPEAFRWRDGRRTPDHNFCPTNEPGLNVIRANAARHFHAHPEVDVFHIWADDIEGGGWCSCETCAPYSASEQLLLATNAVAEVLATIHPDAQISFIAYHDTEAAPARVTPLPNVHMLWAPRMRCYAHSTADQNCPRNVPHYVQTLQEQVAHFQVQGGSPARVFEYYLDAVLFKSVLPPLPTVLQQDARHYRDAGVHTVQALMTGDYAWQTPQLNAWLFAKLLWDPEGDVDHLMQRFSQAAFGADLLAYYRTLERAFQLALDIVPRQVKLTVVHGIAEIWQTPPADMGDPVYAPLEILEEKARQKEALPDLFKEAEQLLLQAASNGQRLGAELIHFELVRSWLEFDRQRTCLYAALQAGRKEEARQAWQLAHRALQEVYRWGEQHIASAAHRVNFRFIQFYTWEIRLRRIKADHFSNQAGKIWLSFVTKFQLFRLYSSLRHLFSAK